MWFMRREHLDQKHNFQQILLQQLGLAMSFGSQNAKPWKMNYISYSRYILTYHNILLFLCYQVKLF